MVSIRRLNLEPEEGSGSDSDVPEQVTLSSGREEAERLIKEEREIRKRVQAEAKQRRQQRNAVKKKEIVSDGHEDFPVADVVEVSANPVQHEEEVKVSKPGKVNEELDTSIIEFLTAQEKEVQEVSTSKPEDENPQTSKRKRKPKGSKGASSSSRVKVVLLDADRPTLANSQSALEFRQKQLYGERVHRSLSMLQQPRLVRHR